MIVVAGGYFLMDTVEFWDPTGTEGWVQGKSKTLLPFYWKPLQISKSLESLSCLLIDSYSTNFYLILLLNLSRI